jgi:tRNA nucleotidyltransferase (CCA-adding enzyme)
MIPQKLLDILSELSTAEWVKALTRSANVFIVGGSVRDAFLNKKIKDIDLIVEGLPLQKIQDIVRPFGKVKIVGESFSVIKFVPFGFEGEPFDIATPRIDRKIGAGHKGFMVITDGVTVLDDLRRRDFTMNSIAVNVKTQELLDPFNGLDAIKNGIIKATDENAFIEDPLRILRGVQFSSRFGFAIEETTIQLMTIYSHLISDLSGERIFEELEKIITKDGDTQVAFDLINKTGIDKSLFGKEMLKYDQGLDHVDIFSFFYLLCLLGGNDNPEDFVKNRLKGDAKLAKNVRILDKIMDIISTTEIAEDKLSLKHMLFNAFNMAPDIMDAVVLTPEIDDVVLEMRMGKIPMKMQDIQITGEDIIALSGIKEGPRIGDIKERIIRDALSNNFDWKDRDKSIAHLESIC